MQIDLPSSDDTIVAIATPLGTGGVALLRLSGPEALAIVNITLVTKHGHSFRNLSDRRAHYGFIRDPRTGESLDEVLVTVMRGPASYTAEDVVEIGCHAGTAAASAILDLMLRQGARLAEPGEFTKRAFLNGRIDLAQAEAVCGLVEARTQASLRTAVHQLRGGLSREIDGIVDTLVKTTAVLEASLDFPEEELDLPEMRDILDELAAVRSHMERLICSYARGRIFREGVTTLLVGKPNVGKSSLFNALLNEDRAIVTETPGTTRDSIEESVNLAGVPFNLVDTAGIRRTGDHIEVLGLRRTTLLLDTADLVLFLIDASSPLTQEDLDVLPHLHGTAVIAVLNKTDLPAAVGAADVTAVLPDTPVLKVSALLRTGIDDLKRAMREPVLSGMDAKAESPTITAARHKEAIARARDALDRALQQLQAGQPAELAIVDLREAMHALGTITGRTVSAEVLDEIFSSFCIGK